MASPEATPGRAIRFGAFGLDLRSGELRKNGVQIRLQEQPLQILILLLERPGEIVTREEIRKKLWPDGTFVDFDHSLNAAVMRLREALDDSADNPRFIETVPRRGYRFLAPVEIHAAPATPPLPRRLWWAAATVVALLLLLALPVVLNVGGLRERVFAPAPPKIRSIAVLPLENLSGDPQHEYFADGMTEALITHLGKLRALRVVSRTSVMQYRGVRKPLREIAQELGVDAIVEGGVQRTGDQAGIMVRLVDPLTERQLWTEDYQHKFTDVLDLQSEVAQAIAREIRVAVSPEEQARLARSRPVDPAAYEAYLKGRYFWQTRTLEGLQKALEFFQTAVQLDPNYALGYAGLADTHLMLGNNAFLPDQETYPKARVAAQKALDLDKDLAEARATMANILGEYDWNWLGAEREFDRALALNPGYATAFHWHAMFLSQMGRHAEAISQIRKARSLDPLSPRINANVALVLYYARKYDEAIQEAQKALEMFPDDGAAHGNLGLAFLQTGSYEQAIRELRRSATLLPGNAAHRLWVARAYARAGQRQEARTIIEAELRARSYAPPYFVGQTHAALGNKDEAFAWLEKAYVKRDSNLGHLRVDPALDSLRDDPRFQDLLRRMNFPK